MCRKKQGPKQKSIIINSKCVGEGEGREWCEGGKKTNKVERAKQGLNVNKNRMRVSLQRERERENINKHIVINIGVYVNVERSFEK